MACLFDQEAAGRHGRAGHLRGAAAVGRRPGLTEALELKAAAGASGTGDHRKGS